MKKLTLKSKSRIISLDWDSKKEMQKWYKKISDVIPAQFITDIHVRRSSTKGYHCKIFTSIPFLEVYTRFNLGDDARRIVLDMLRPAKINNILWDVKVIRGKRYKAQKWKDTK